MKVCIIQAMYLDVTTKSLDKAFKDFKAKVREAFPLDAWQQVGAPKPKMQLVRFGGYSVAKCNKKGFPMINQVVRARAQREKR